MSQHPHTNWIDFKRAYGSDIEDALIRGGAAHERAHGPTHAVAPKIVSDAAIFNPSTPATDDEPATRLWQKMVQWEADDDDIGVAGAMPLAKANPGVPVQGVEQGVPFTLAWEPEGALDNADADVVAILGDRIGLNVILPKTVIYPLVEAWAVYQGEEDGEYVADAVALLDGVVELLIIALHHTFGGD